MFRESSVLRAATAAGAAAPRVLYDCEDFQVHAFVPGTIVEEAVPSGTRPPDSIVATVWASQALLDSVGRSELLELPSRRCFARTQYDSSEGFAESLRDWLSRVYVVAPAPAKLAMAEVGISGDPFTSTIGLHDVNRPLRLCHGDLSRGNCMIHRGRVTILDWELSLWGDPAWDIASFFHRFGLTREQEEHILSQGAPVPSDNLRVDVEAYRKLEVDRSLVIDCVRLVQAWGSYDPQRVGEYTDKVAKLRPDLLADHQSAAYRIRRLLNTIRV